MKFVHWSRSCWRLDCLHWAACWRIHSVCQCCVMWRFCKTRKNIKNLVLNRFMELYHLFTSRYLCSQFKWTGRKLPVSQQTYNLGMSIFNIYWTHIQLYTIYWILWRNHFKESLRRYLTASRQQQGEQAAVGGESCLLVFTGLCSSFWLQQISNVDKRSV